MPKQKRSWFVQSILVTSRIVLFLVLVGLVMAVIALSNVYQAYSQVQKNLELVADTDIQGSQATLIYARDYDPQTAKGTLLAAIAKQNRQLAGYDELSPLLVACVLSTEDARFFEHHGVDIQGTFRAALNILKRGGQVRGGGSSITQQLARNVFLSKTMTEKSLNRKMQEMILAMSLEKKLSKQEILEKYLNQIFYGANAYGVKAAARTFFNKDLNQLTLPECALLAGLPQRPTGYNPTIAANQERAKARRNEVLDLLDSRLDDGYLDSLQQADSELFAKISLTHEDIAQAKAAPLTVNPQVEPDYMRNPYFTSYVRDHVLFSRYSPDQVLRQGMTVVTTLDPQIQSWAEQILKEKIDANRKARKVSQGAIIVLEAKTGEVLACVGGYEWGSPNKDGDPDKYNRAMLKGRPTGSSFKAFTYATAYEQGFAPGTTVFDGPNKEESARVGKAWPHNSDGTYWGWISMFYALQNSRNAAAVDVITNLTGIDPVIQTARRMGVTADLPSVPALTLGVADIKPLEMAGAFDTFVNMGLHITPTTVRRVYNQDGLLIENNESPEVRSNRALSANTAWIMVQNMRRVVEAGTGTGARVSGVQIAGKTGTNDDFADAWFVGYSPEIVCAVWVGNDDYHQQMNRVFGGGLPAEIFKALMTKIYTKQTTTTGEGEAAVETVTWEPRYTQTEFVKPEGATFNGFGGAVTGSKLVQDENGNWVSEDKAKEEEQQPGDEGDGGGDGGSNDDNGFYDDWQPPPNVFF